MDAKTEKKIKEIIEKINYYSDLYYNHGVSEISDAEFDRLYDEFLDFAEKYPEIKEWEDSPIKKVGADATSNFEKFSHKSPLLSIDQKSRELEDLKKWYDKLTGKQVIVEPKLDGITININYEKGKFVNAATRGNGYIGDLITKQFKNTKTKYPEAISMCKELELRGEAIIPYDYFIENNLNESYSNPRNAVAGIMHSKDPDDVKGKGVEVMFYDIGQIDANMLSDLDSTNVEEIIRNAGFTCAPYFICNSWEELKKCVETKFYGHIQEIDGFNILKYDGYPQAMCDGLVIKSNHLHEREELGFSQKGPKWAFAFKFKALSAKTTLLDVSWDVSKSGRITPVAVFKEVSLGGTKINRATLNNFGYMSNLPKFNENKIDLSETDKLHKSDEILVERSNDVIPRIVAIVKHNTTEVCKAPKVCPVCGGEVEFRNDLLYCVNPNCSAKISSKIEHFASRNAMNIVGLGEKIVDILLENDLISNITDIYDLTSKKVVLVNLEGFGKKSVDKLLSSIENSKNPELSNFIFALAIPNVGEKMSKDLANYYKSIDNLINNFSYNQILSLESFGEVYAESTTSWLSKIENIKTIKDLLSKGVKPKEVEQKEQVSNTLNGKTFVITGTLSKPRKYFEDLIVSNGGKVGSGVSKNTDYVLAGENAGSKLEKAEKLKIEIIDENEFNRKVGTYDNN